jgi:tRNA (guanine37-N1)-methyltransferase
MEIDILSLFPEYFQGPFDESILKQAQISGHLSIRHTNIRDFATGKHRRVDDRPYGGGPGMVLMPDPLSKAIHAVSRPQTKLIYMSPQGTPLSAKKCRELAQEEHLVIMCGHYEGVDQRIIDGYVDEEISIGDYVLTNGCLGAIVLIDAMARFIPGVLGHEEAANEDSFEQGSLGILDCPHYTRPETFEGRSVPKVLLGGDHQAITQWRLERGMDKTERVRPDLYLKAHLQESSGETSTTAQSVTPTLWVNEIDKTTRFYRKGLGLPVEKITHSHVEVCAGGQIIVLRARAQQRETLPLTTFELVVDTEEDLRKVARRLSREKYIVDIETADNALTKVVTQDPEGHCWQIVMRR